jgi:methylaspartate ammonia-lyase
VVVVCGLALLAAAQLVTARARAVTAADAAALAAAPHTFPVFAPEGAASEIAADLALANGARLLRCHCPLVATYDPRTVEVEVMVATRIAFFGDVAVRAQSRAEYVP